MSKPGLAGESILGPEGVGIRRRPLSTPLASPRVWASLFALLVGLIILAADTGHVGFIRRLYAFPNGDKVGHFGVYGILSLLVNLSIREVTPGRMLKHMVAKSSLLLAVAIGLEELSQVWIPGRTFSLTDLGAS